MILQIMTDKSPPFFTIATITKENIDGLKATYQSLLEQQSSDYEWIVIDGASGDGTLQFLEDHANEITYRVSEPDRGIYHAMNKAIDRASGDYLLFLNAGDCLADDYVLGQVKSLIDSQDFVYGDALERLEDDQIVLKPARDHQKIFWGMITHHQAMFYRRSCLGDLRYSENYHISADYGFTLDFIDRAKSVLKLELPICIFEFGGISQIQAKKGRKEQLLIRLVRDKGMISSYMIYGLQSLTWIVRQLFPKLYQWLRFRASKTLR